MSEVYINVQDMEEGWFKHRLEKEFPKKNLLSIEELLDFIDDLMCKVDDLIDEKEKIIQDRNDNWKPISIKEQIDYSEKW